MVMIAAMMPRTLPTLRYLRQFNIIYIEPFDNDSLFQIFSNLVDEEFNKLEFSKEIFEYKDIII